MYHITFSYNIFVRNYRQLIVEQINNALAPKQRATKWNFSICWQNSLTTLWWIFWALSSWQEAWLTRSLDLTWLIFYVCLLKSPVPTVDSFTSEVHRVFDQQVRELHPQCWTILNQKWIWWKSTSFWTAYFFIINVFIIINLIAFCIDLICKVDNK